MAKLDALLVHQEPHIRQQLRQYLATATHIRVLGEATRLDEAITLINALSYGVVFSGIDLETKQQGLELAHFILRCKHPPALIFLASTPDLAFDAFELNATDYLIFPCSTERFERTLMRLQQFQTHFRLAPPPGSHWKEQYIPKRELPSHSIPLATPSTGDVLPSVHAAIQNHNFSQIDSQTIQADSQLFLEASKQASTATPIDVPPIQQGETVTIAIGEQEQEHLASALKKAWKNTTADIPPTDLDKLAIPFEGKTRFIPYVDIAFIEAFEDYSYVHTAEERYLTNYRLKNVEARLRLHRFFRVHRKYLVNLDMVTELATVSGNHCVLRTAGRTRIELPISRRRLSDLKQALGM